MKHIKKWFTLVELLVVITILTILGTIAYVYFESSLWESRDAKRESDLLEIVNVLELYYTENTQLPEPSNSVNITYSWSAIAWTQWTFGESVARDVKLFGQDFPIDPLFWNEYTYSITAKANEFQVAAVKETFEQEEWLWELAWNILTPSASANLIETAYVLWDYNSFMVNAREGRVDNFIASPSIIASDISNPDVLNIISNQKLVYNEFFNLPHSYNEHLDVDGGFAFNVVNPLVFSGDSRNLRSEEELLTFNENLKFIYATTPTESFDQYVSILEQDGLTSLKWFLERKFKIIFKSHFNCKDILDAGLDDGDRFYIIDPDGPGGEDEYEVFCDMTTDGWGWTRVWDNHVTNGNFSGWVGVTDAIENTDDAHSIVALTTPVDDNEYALHQTGNFSSNYQIGFDDPSVLRPGYEIRMSMWRSDFWSWAVASTTNDTVVMGWKQTPYTLDTCVSGNTCYFQHFNRKMANSANFWLGWNLTDIDISVSPPVTNITNTYLNGGVLFDGFVPVASTSRIRDAGFNSGSFTYNLTGYSAAEKTAINDWVEAGGFLVSTNDTETYDPLGEYYSMPTTRYNDNLNDQWVVENIDHPIVNGSLGLWVDLRWKTLTSSYAHSALTGEILPEDVVLARDKRFPHAPTVILRRVEKWAVLITSGDGVFKDMSAGNTFDPNDLETVFAAAVMAYAIEEAAGINPHEGYVFHNRTYYSDGTFSTNGEDVTLETITVDDGGTPRVWTREQTRHRIYKTPEDFNWFIWLDANNNKDLYFTGIRLELFYR